MNPPQSTEKHFIFAGGGTGGHIYPGIAVAQQIREKLPDAEINFFCSKRPVDSHILSRTDFRFTPLDAKIPSARPDRLFSFLTSLHKSFYKAKSMLTPNSVVIATGGFVSVPVVLAASRLNLPVVLINVDIVPGKANKLLKRFAKYVFMQFEESNRCFVNSKAKIVTTGCPLRKEFFKPHPESVYENLALDIDKNTLLVTGASSGAVTINNAVTGILDDLEQFADTWQIIHLTGKANLKSVEESYAGTKIHYHLVDYYDQMQDLFAASDLVIGRGGAVSVAEFTQAQKPVICMPYPYHKDNHQARNIAQLCEKGSALIVEDTPDKPAQTRGRLSDVLKDLMSNKEKLEEMKNAACRTPTPKAAEIITETVCKL